MADLDPRTPVLVGIGIVEQRLDDPALASEPIALMIDAVRRAGADAGITAELPAVERVLVPQGLWSYGDPGRMIADAIGAEAARTVYAKLGVMQQTLIDDACLGISSGEWDLAVVAGGEARYRGLKAELAGGPASETVNTATPDVLMEPDAELYHDVEIAALGHMPVGYYAIMESAFRAAQGWSVEHHRDRLAALYSRFSEIAVANPMLGSARFCRRKPFATPRTETRCWRFPTPSITTRPGMSTRPLLCYCAVPSGPVRWGYPAASGCFRWPARNPITCSVWHRSRSCTVCLGPALPASGPCAWPT